MRKPSIDAKKLLAFGNNLGGAVIDPTIWPQLLSQISVAVGAAGAGLLQSDVRTANIPRSVGVEDVFNDYFKNGWHTRDVRAERGVPLLIKGQKVIIDQDIITSDEIKRLGFYREHLAQTGFQWFAAIGFFSGSALWGLSIQRTEKEGPFHTNDKKVLAHLSQRLTETATLSKAVGRAVLSGVTNAMDMVKQPALAIDRRGFVLEINSKAEQILDDDVRVHNRRLVLRDQHAKSFIEALIARLCATPDNAALTVEPIVVRRKTKQPLVIRVLPVDSAARTPFLDARALLILSDLNLRSAPETDILSRVFLLSPAETRLACLLATGISLEQAAQKLAVSRDTVRNQLKAVFAKTDTHRQSELVALLSRV